MERPRPPITVGPVRPPGPVIPFAGAGTSSIAAPQTQFGGYGVAMPTTPLMQYAGLNPSKERAPQPDPIVLPPQPAPEPEPIFAPAPPPPPPITDPDLRGESPTAPTAPGSDFQAGLKYTDTEGPTGYYPGPTPDRPSPPPPPIPGDASDYGIDVLLRATDSNLPPEVIVAMDQQREDPTAKIDVNIGTFDPTSSKEDLRLSSAPAVITPPPAAVTPPPSGLLEKLVDQVREAAGGEASEISLPEGVTPEGVTPGGEYYDDPITGNRMYQPPMPKRSPGTSGIQAMPTPIDLTTGKPKEFTFDGMLPPPKKAPPKKPVPPKRTPPKITVGPVRPPRPVIPKAPPKKTPPGVVLGRGRKGQGSGKPVPPKKTLPKKTPPKKPSPPKKTPPKKTPPKRTPPPKKTPPKKTPPKRTPPKRTPPKKPSPPKRPPFSIFDRIPSSGPTGYSV